MALPPDIEALYRKILSRRKKALRIDRQSVTRELNRLMNTYAETSGDAQMIQKLQVLDKRLNGSVKEKIKRKAGVPRIIYPETLPILTRKDDIINAIRQNRVVVITGETGSGKTTQIPKMCLEAGLGTDGLIGCTQPRRIAAITVSQRIAEELKQEPGTTVGYKIRFEDKSSRENYIKVMTDGILLMEAQADPFLNAYDAIIVDEAHERSINIDFILGILKRLITKRRDLKVIITSATIDTKKFSRAFNDAPIIEASGRLYPVELRYQPIDKDREEKGDMSYIDAAVHAAGMLKKERQRGDILIFMPTEQDIRETCDIITGKNYKNTLVFPLFGRLSAPEQRRVFMPRQEDKIVVATNVAETSITIPGIKYVIDTGLARIAEYNPGTRTRGLPIKAISKSSADQRKGRCGRVQDGVCIRLYSEEDYEKRSIFTPPEILRSNLAEVILRMISLKIGDVHSFPFIDAPHPKNIKDGFDILEELDAIRADKKKGGMRVDYSLTAKGQTMARLPIDPRISRMIIEARKEGCVDDVLVIASALSLQDPRERPLEKESQADQMHKPFINPASDFITLLNIWNRYHDMWDTLKTQNKMRKFCTSHFLSYKRMREWKDVHHQIGTILKEEKITIRHRKKLQGETLYAGIHKSILSGYLSNIAIKEEKNNYRKAKGKEIMVFPGSGVFNKGDSWIVAAELIETSRLFARIVANIKTEWLEEVGKSLCRYSYSSPHWDRKRGEVMAYEQVTLYGLPIVSGRRVSFGPIDPAAAGETFIRSALIEGELDKPFPFLVHNRNLIEKITTMEDKIRRRDVLIGTDALSDFYTQRLANVYDIRTLQTKIKDHGGDSFLMMTEEELLQYDPAEELTLYPDEISLGNTCLPTTYHFDHGKPDDGVTVKIPARIASSVPLDSIDWIVPGLLREKITTLIKGLPKNYRKKLVPVTQTIEIIMKEMKKSEGSLVSALGRFIYDRFNVDIPSTAWASHVLPDYLKTRISVVDDEGKELFSGRDLHRVPGNLEYDASSAFISAKAQWEKTGSTKWDFGDLPQSTAIQDDETGPIVFYPALERGDGCVNIRLFQDSIQAGLSHRDGIIALYELHFRKDLQYLKKTLAVKGTMKTWATYFGGIKRFEENLYRRVIRALFDNPIRNEGAFLEHAQTVKPVLLLKGQELLQKVEPVLRAYHETRSALHDLQKANGSRSGVVTFIGELRHDLNRLLPENFLEIYDSDKLSHIPRYLKAVAVRAERGILHLEKDRIKSGELIIFHTYLKNWRDGLSRHPSDEKKKATEEFAWMLEEYRVSLFAQELKTAFPVSRKRLENKAREIDRMA
jgi:ATP-dependent helicase HrpA